MTHKLLCLIQLVLVLSPSLCMLKTPNLPTKVDVKAATTKPEPDSYFFEILHFNDAYDIFKSAFFLAKWQENETKNTLKFFSGDLYSPSDYSSDFEGKQFIPFLEHAKIDAAVVGNHEFDYGEKVFMELKSYPYSDFWLNTNVLHLPQGQEKRGQPYGHVPQYALLEAGEHNEILVGVIGLADESWLTSSHLKKNMYQLVDPVVAAKSWAKKLKENGAHIVIALTHMSNTSDKKIIEEDSDIDFVLGGHEHMYYYAQVKEKFVLKSGVDFEHFSRLKITKDARPIQNTFQNGYEFVLTNENQNQIPTTINLAIPHAGQFLNVVIERIAVPMAPSDPKHEEMEQQLAVWRHQFAYLLEPAFQLDGDLDAREETVRTGETTLCQLVTDLLRLEAKTEIAMLNSGGFRLNKQMKAGEIITWGDMRKLLPFKDEIVRVILDADEIVKFLEQGLEGYLGEKRKPIMNVSGLTFKFDETKGKDNRVVRESIIINGKRMDNNLKYSIAVTKFHGEGGDGFTIFSQAKSTPQLIENMTPMGIMKNAWQTPMRDKKKVAQFKQFKSRYPGITIDGLYNVDQIENVEKNKRMVAFSPSILPSKAVEVIPQSIVALNKYLATNLGDTARAGTKKPNTHNTGVVESSVPKVTENKEGKTAIRTNKLMEMFDMDQRPNGSRQRNPSTDYMSKAGETNRFTPQANLNNAFHALFKDTSHVDGHEVFMIDPTLVSPRITNIRGTPLGDLRPKEAPLISIKTEARRMV